MRSKLLLTVLLCVGLGAVQAQQPHNRAPQPQRHTPDRPYRTGDITIVSPQPVWMAIDNRLYQISGTNLTIGNLPQGNHRLQLFRQQNSRRGGMGPLLYEVTIRIQSGQRLLGEWDAAKRLLRFSDQNLNYLDYNSGYQILGGQQQPGYTEDPAYADDYDFPLPAGRFSPLSQQQLGDLKVIVNRLVADATKLDQMKKLLAEKSVTAGQLRQMGAWLSFENYRLDFLKWAYVHTEDKENFMQVYPLLTFDSSIRELTEFVYQQR